MTCTNSEHFFTTMHTGIVQSARDNVDDSVWDAEGLVKLLGIGHHALMLLPRLVAARVHHHKLGGVQSIWLLRNKVGCKALDIETRWGAK